jgi:hypothetical protein
MIALAMAVLMLAVNSKPAPDGLGQDRPVNKQPIGVSVQSPDVPRLRKLLLKTRRFLRHAEQGWP